MMSLASFLVTQTGALRACLWAHAGHVSKQPGTRGLGYQLATSGLRYYATGFFLYQGSARAWDPSANIGVIGHPIPVAPDYAVENVVMKAAGMPDVAWAPLRRLPPSLKRWLQVPRFVRELQSS
jgi:erythromycin esterase-like protein